MTESEALELLKQAVTEAGSQYAYAKQHRIDRMYLNNVLRSKQRMGNLVLNSLGLERITVTDIRPKQQLTT